MDSIPKSDKLHPATMKSIVSTIHTIRKDDQNATPCENLSRVSALDNTSVPYFIPHSKQKPLISNLRTLAAEKSNRLVSTASNFLLLSCLYARKGDISRSLALATNYLTFRQDFSYDLYISSPSSTLREILSAGIFIPPGNFSRDGRPVLTIRYRFFDPRKFSAADTACATAFVLEWMLRTIPKAMTHGVSIVEDVNGFSLRNMDVRLMHFYDRAFTSVLPVRVAALHITNPGFIIRTVFTVFSAFLSDKLKARIRLFRKGQEDMFAEFFEPEQNLKFLGLGGTLHWTEMQQRELAAHMLECVKQWTE